MLPAVFWTPAWLKATGSTCSEANPANSSARAGGDQVHFVFRLDEVTDPVAGSRGMSIGNVEQSHDGLNVQQEWGKRNGGLVDSRQPVDGSALCLS